MKAREKGDQRASDALKELRRQELEAEKREARQSRVETILHVRVSWPAFCALRCCPNKVALVMLYFLVSGLLCAAASVALLQTKNYLSEDLYRRGLQHMELNAHRLRLHASPYFQLGEKPSYSDHRFVAVAAPLVFPSVHKSLSFLFFFEFGACWGKLLHLEVFAGHSHGSCHVHAPHSKVYEDKDLVIRTIFGKKLGLKSHSLFRCASPFIRCASSFFFVDSLALAMTLAWCIYSTPLLLGCALCAVPMHLGSRGRGI